MPKPVINTTQSVLGYLQFQSFSYQPVALNTPTSWSVSTLPSGLSLNTSSGLISGAVTQPGVYVFALRATNSSGTSDPVIYTLGIEASAASTGTDVDMVWDLTSGRVTPASAIPPAGTGTDDAQAPVARVVLEDQRIFNLRLVKNGVTIDVTPSSFKLSIEADEGEAALVTSGAHHKVSSGDNARYRIPVNFTTPAVRDAVTNSDDVLAGLAKLELTYTNPDSGTVGSANIVVGSQTFVIAIAPNGTL